MEAVKVSFKFNPYRSENPEIRQVFEDDVAAVIWIGIKRSHLVSDNFNRCCLLLAKELKKKKWADIIGPELNQLLLNTGVIGSGEKTVGEELLPFIRGEKAFEVSIYITGRVSR